MQGHAIDHIRSAKHPVRNFEVSCSKGLTGEQSQKQYRLEKCLFYLVKEERVWLIKETFPTVFILDPGPGKKFGMELPVADPNLSSEPHASSSKPRNIRCV